MCGERSQNKMRSADRCKTVAVIRPRRETSARRTASRSERNSEPHPESFARDFVGRILAGGPITLIVGERSCGSKRDCRRSSSCSHQRQTHCRATTWRAKPAAHQQPILAARHLGGRQATQRRSGAVASWAGRVLRIHWRWHRGRHKVGRRAARPILTGGITAAGGRGGANLGPA